MALNKADFYFGALLSQLVNSGFAPAIIEKGDSRRVYSIANNYDDYKIYTKYVAKPTSIGKDSKQWDFNFNEDEAEAIIADKTTNIYGFVCGVDGLKDSEILLLKREELDMCFGKDFISPTRRVTARIDKKGSWTFMVYGTGLERKENPLKITRNPEKRLEDFLSIAVQ